MGLSWQAASCTVWCSDILPLHFIVCHSTSLVHLPLQAMGWSCPLSFTRPLWMASTTLQTNWFSQTLSSTTGPTLLAMATPMGRGIMMQEALASSTPRWAGELQCKCAWGKEHWQYHSRRCLQIENFSSQGNQGADTDCHTSYNISPQCRAFSTGTSNYMAVWFMYYTDSEGIVTAKSSLSPLFISLLITHSLSSY